MRTGTRLQLELSVYAIFALSERPFLTFLGRFDAFYCMLYINPSSLSSFCRASYAFIVPLAFAFVFIASRYSSCSFIRFLDVIRTTRKYEYSPPSQSAQYDQPKTFERDATIQAIEAERGPSRPGIPQDLKMLALDEAAVPDSAEGTNPRMDQLHEYRVGLGMGHGDSYSCLCTSSLARTSRLARCELRAGVLGHRGATARRCTMIWFPGDFMCFHCKA